MSNYDPTNPQANGATPQPPTYGQATPPPPPAYGTAGSATPPPPAYSDAGSATPPPPPVYGQMGSMPPAGYTPAAPVARPKSMDLAVRLMQAGGVLALLNALTVFLFKDEIRDAAEKAAADAGTNIDIDAAVNAAMIFGAIFGLLGAALWFWMASANGKGKSWARIVASVFYVISLLSFVYSFTQPAGFLSRILGIISFLIATGAIVMMWKKESSDFYAANSAPRV